MCLTGKSMKTLTTSANVIEHIDELCRQAFCIYFNHNTSLFDLSNPQNAYIWCSKCVSEHLKLWVLRCKAPFSNLITKGGMATDGLTLWNLLPWQLMNNEWQSTFPFVYCLLQDISYCWIPIPNCVIAEETVLFFAKKQVLRGFRWNVRVT